jgi:hypothetical protein
MQDKSRRKPLGPRRPGGDASGRPEGDQRLERGQPAGVQSPDIVRVLAEGAQGTKGTRGKSPEVFFNAQRGRDFQEDQRSMAPVNSGVHGELRRSTMPRVGKHGDAAVPSTDTRRQTTWPPADSSSRHDLYTNSLYPSFIPRLRPPYDHSSTPSSNEVPPYRLTPPEQTNQSAESSTQRTRGLEISKSPQLQWIDHKIRTMQGELKTYELLEQENNQANLDLKQDNTRLNERRKIHSEIDQELDKIEIREKQLVEFLPIYQRQAHYDEPSAREAQTLAKHLKECEQRRGELTVQWLTWKNSDPALHGQYKIEGGKGLRSALDEETTTIVKEEFALEKRETDLRSEMQTILEKKQELTDQLREAHSEWNEVIKMV